MNVYHKNVCSSLVDACSGAVGVHSYAFENPYSLLTSITQFDWVGDSKNTFESYDCEIDTVVYNTVRELCRSVHAVSLVDAEGAELFDIDLTYRLVLVDPTDTATLRLCTCDKNVINDGFVNKGNEVYVVVCTSALRANMAWALFMEGANVGVSNMEKVANHVLRFHLNAKTGVVEGLGGRNAATCDHEPGRNMHAVTCIGGRGDRMLDETPVGSMADCAGAGRRLASVLDDSPLGYLLSVNALGGRDDPMRDETPVGYMVACGGIGGRHVCVLDDVLSGHMVAIAGLGGRFVRMIDETPGGCMTDCVGVGGRAALVLDETPVGCMTNGAGVGGRNVRMIDETPAGCMTDCAGGGGRHVPVLDETPVGTMRNCAGVGGRHASVLDEPPVGSMTDCVGCGGRGASVLDDVLTGHTSVAKGIGGRGVRVIDEPPVGCMTDCVGCGGRGASVLDDVLTGHTSVTTGLGRRGACMIDETPVGCMADCAGGGGRDMPVVDEMPSGHVFPANGLGGRDAPMLDEPLAEIAVLCVGGGGRTVPMLDDPVKVSVQPLVLNGIKSAEDIAGSKFTVAKKSVLDGTTSPYVLKYVEEYVYEMRVFPSSRVLVDVDRSAGTVVIHLDTSGTPEPITHRGRVPICTELTAFATMKIQVKSGDKVVSDCVILGKEVRHTVRAEFEKNPAMVIDELTPKILKIVDEDLKLNIDHKFQNENVIGDIFNSCKQDFTQTWIEEVAGKLKPTGGLKSTTCGLLLYDLSVAEFPAHGKKSGSFMHAVCSGVFAGGKIDVSALGVIATCPDGVGNAELYFHGMASIVIMLCQTYTFDELSRVLQIFGMRIDIGNAPDVLTECFDKKNVFSQSRKNTLLYISSEFSVFLDRATDVLATFLFVKIKMLLVTSDLIRVCMELNDSGTSRRLAFATRHTSGRDEHMKVLATVEKSITNEICQTSALVGAAGMTSAHAQMVRESVRLYFWGAVFGVQSSTYIATEENAFFTEVAYEKFTKIHSNFGFYSGIDSTPYVAYSDMCADMNTQSTCAAFQAVWGKYASRDRVHANLQTVVDLKMVAIRSDRAVISTNNLSNFKGKQIFLSFVGCDQYDANNIRFDGTGYGENRLFLLYIPTDDMFMLNVLKIGDLQGYTAVLPRSESNVCGKFVQTFKSWNRPFARGVAGENCMDLMKREFPTLRNHLLRHIHIRSFIFCLLSGVAIGTARQVKECAHECLRIHTLFNHTDLTNQILTSYVFGVCRCAMETALDSGPAVTVVVPDTSAAALQRLTYYDTVSSDENGDCIKDLKTAGFNKVDKKTRAEGLKLEATRVFPGHYLCTLTDADVLKVVDSYGTLRTDIPELLIDVKGIMRTRMDCHIKRFNSQSAVFATRVCIENVDEYLSKNPSKTPVNVPAVGGGVAKITWKRWMGTKVTTVPSVVHSIVQMGRYTKLIEDRDPVATSDVSVPSPHITYSKHSSIQNFDKATVSGVCRPVFDKHLSKVVGVHVGVDRRECVYEYLNFVAIAIAKEYAIGDTDCVIKFIEQLDVANPSIIAGKSKIFNRTSMDFDYDHRHSTILSHLTMFAIDPAMLQDCMERVRFVTKQRGVRLRFMTQLEYENDKNGETLTYLTGIETTSCNSFTNPNQPAGKGVPAKVSANKAIVAEIASNYETLLGLLRCDPSHGVENEFSAFPSTVYVEKRAWDGMSLSNYSHLVIRGGGRENTPDVCYILRKGCLVHSTGVTRLQQEYKKFAAFKTAVGTAQSNTNHASLSTDSVIDVCAYMVGAPSYHTTTTTDKAVVVRDFGKSLGFDALDAADQVVDVYATVGGAVRENEVLLVEFHTNEMKDWTVTNPGGSFGSGAGGTAVEFAYVTVESWMLKNCISSTSGRFKCLEFGLGFHPDSGVYFAVRLDALVASKSITCDGVRVVDTCGNALGIDAQLLALAAASHVERSEIKKSVDTKHDKKVTQKRVESEKKANASLHDDDQRKRESKTPISKLVVDEDEVMMQRDKRYDVTGYRHASGTHEYMIHICTVNEREITPGSVYNTAIDMANNADATHGNQTHDADGRDDGGHAQNMFMYVKIRAKSTETSFVCVGFMQVKCKRSTLHINDFFVDTTYVDILKRFVDASGLLSYFMAHAMHCNSEAMQCNCDHRHTSILPGTVFDEKNDQFHKDFFVHSEKPTTGDINIVVFTRNRRGVSIHQNRRVVYMCPFQRNTDASEAMPNQQTLTFTCT